MKCKKIALRKVDGLRRKIIYNHSFLTSLEHRPDARKENMYFFYLESRQTFNYIEPLVQERTLVFRYTIAFPAQGRNTVSERT